VPRFRDVRALFDKMGAQFDAVVISTPDHSHLPLAVHAMRHGKHVYLETPRAHTFQEVDLVIALAAKTGLVTRMGSVVGAAAASYRERYETSAPPPGRQPARASPGTLLPMAYWVYYLSVE
jgi:hypothetical protein